MIWSKNSLLRQMLSKLIIDPYFDRLVYSIIGFSSILLAIDEPYLS